MVEAVLFLMGFASVTAVYEVAKSAKVSSANKKISRTLKKELEKLKKQ